MVYEYALVSPCGWFNIIWRPTRRNKICVTEELSRKEILSNMCISMLYLNSEPNLSGRYLMIPPDELLDKFRKLF